MKEVSVQELKEKIEGQHAFILIDVREPYEFEEANLGGRLIPLGDFIDQIPTLEPHRNDEIILHCRSGKRSAMAVEVLENAGFSNVHNLTGGILQWQETFPGQ